MNLLLKYKDKIVSFGLLPIIITLIGIHLFPTTAMLGTGLAISIAGLLYDVLRLKGLFSSFCRELSELVSASF